MRTRFMRFAVPLVLLGLVAAACGNNNDNTGASGASGGSGATGATGPTCNADIKVGVAFDVGGLGDKSFNDAANAGVTKAIADGLVCKEKRGLSPSGSPPRMLGYLAARKLGMISYRELGEKMPMRESNDLSIAYMGYAVKG